jgi:V8-like Glu-specific endopeptidase
MKIAIIWTLLLTNIIFASDDTQFVDYETKIINGTQVSSSDDTWRFIATLNWNGNQYCGGSVISPHWVLTAAHCLSTSDGTVYTVYSGDTVGVGSYNKNTTTIHSIKKFYIHPNYNPVTYDYDIGLVELNDAVDVPIVAYDTSHPLTAGTQTMSAGWGTMDADVDDYPVNLQEAVVPIIDTSLCNSQSSYNGDITSNMICAGYMSGLRDTCQGDSGGPLIVNNTVVGIVSWGNGCAVPNYPGVYTKVKNFASWIKSTVEEPDIIDRMLSDVNGDDMEDIIGFGTKGVSVALSNGSGFDSASLWLNNFGYDQGWTSDKTLRKMGDVNGDGLADVVGFGTTGVFVALSNGSGFDDASLWLADFGYDQGWRLDKGLRVLADVNGDTKADIVAFGNNGVSVALSNGSDFNNARLWVNDFGYNQGWRNDKGLRMLADVNGDNQADIVAFGNAGVSVALSGGSSFVNARRWVDDFGYNQGWRNDKGLRYMADVNGDTKADIVAFGNNGVSVAISNGNSFVNAQRWVDDFGYNQGWRNEKGLRMMADVNDDGKADIVAFGNNGVSVAISNGSDFENSSRWLDDMGYDQGWRNDTHLRVTSDVNGDGYADIVGFGNTGVSVGTSTGADFSNASLWLNDFGFNQGWKVDFSPFQAQQ